MLRKGLKKEVILEQRPASMVGRSHVITWGKSILGRWNWGCKGSKLGECEEHLEKSVLQGFVLKRDSETG